MSLTLFIDKKKKSLGVVKWFLDPNYGIAYPTDPIKEIDCEEPLRGVSEKTRSPKGPHSSLRWYRVEEIPEGSDPLSYR